MEKKKHRNMHRHADSCIILHVSALAAHVPLDGVHATRKIRRKSVFELHNATLRLLLNVL